MSTVSTRFRKGWFHDPEDWHSNYRMNDALALLKAEDIEPSWTHGNDPINQWVDFGRVRHMCASNCTVAWPEWVTDEIFDAAYNLADLIQTARGAHHRAAAYKLHEAAVAESKAKGGK